MRAFADGAVSLSPAGLGLTLFAMLAGAALIAAMVRRLAGTETIARRRTELDGMSVLLLLVFCCALMHDVAARSYADPLQAIGLVVLAFGVGIAMLVVTVLVFSPAGWRDAFALGLDDVAAQYRPDAGGGRQRLAGSGLVLFRDGAVPDLLRALPARARSFSRMGCRAAVCPPGPPV